MITSLFLIIVSGVIVIVAALLPASMTLPDSLTQWVAYFHAGIQLVGFIIPLDQLFAILSMFLAIQGALFLWRVTLGIWGVIRGGHWG
jgi:hypothetical protein